jgi:hypothetical protein
LCPEGQQPPPQGGFFIALFRARFNRLDAWKGTILAVSLPNGVILSLATTYAAADTVTAVTNANPAVATTGSAHGITGGNFLEVTSGWSRLNNRIVRAASASGSSVTYEGIDTASTANYPAGTGVGSVREITGWTQISQILDLSTSGGEMQFVSYSFLEQDFESQLPTQASAMSLTFTVADDPTLAGYLAIKAAAETRALVGLKASLPNGSIILFNGYASFNETPTMSKGQIMGCQATFSLQGKPVRYAS